MRHREITAYVPALPAMSMKYALAAVAGIAALVLLLGAALTTAPASAVADSPGKHPAQLPPAAAPFAGTAAGCSLPDPTGTGGCVTPATAWVVEQITARIGPVPTSCWDRHAWNPTSDHPLGRACDVTFGRLGTFPGSADVKRGWELANWLRANSDRLRVSYVIWQGRIWSAQRAGQGWRTYTGGGVYDASDPTGGHYDHVHVSVTE